MPTDSPTPAQAKNNGAARSTDHIVGERIRHLRQARSMSIKELASGAGLSIALISQIERGISSASVRVLAKLADGLDVAISDLFEPALEDAVSDRIVARVHERRHIDLNRTGIHKELLTPFARQPRLDLYMMTIEPHGSSSDEPFVHQGEEAGVVLEGGIEDAENAVFFALGINATPRLQVGLGVKVIDHRIETPQAGQSSADGRAVDLGLRYRLGEHTVVGLAARNLLDKLSWSVVRPSAQTSSADEALMSVLALGVVHGWRGVVRAAFDVEWLDVGGQRNLRAHGGIEATVNDLLTLRCGVHRMGDADGFGLPAFGVTLRPMRIETVQIHYAWVADDIDAGGRTVLALSSSF